MDWTRKSLPYYYPWQTCYIHHLLNSMGSIHPLTCFKVLWQSKYNISDYITISVYSQVLIYGRVI